MKKLLSLLLVLCLCAALGGAALASGEPSSDASSEASGEAPVPGGEALPASSAVRTQSTVVSGTGLLPGAGGSTALDLRFNGVRVADLGIGVVQNADGSYTFSLAALQSLLGLELHYSEADDVLYVDDDLGVLGALLD